MRALQIREIGQPLAAISLPEPEPGPSEVLVRIEACGICHSDAHYRRGFGALVLPRTPGHEVAGVVAHCGAGVALLPGTRVAIHYLISCGACDRCRGAGEQFCRHGQMIGKDRDGGYAEAIVVPERNAVPVPDGVALTHAAVMMCSTATAYHALRLAEVEPGARIALLGFGGLGASALQLARCLGASAIAAVDVVAEKLALAERQGAVGIDASRADFDAALASFAGSHGIDVALDFAGHPETSGAALRHLAPQGRLMLVALTREAPPFDPYRLLGREARIAGCSDHLRSELVELLQMASDRRIDLAAAISGTVPLDADAVNGALDTLESRTAGLRTVIVR